ncbi:MAG TPA: hypothetical protein VGC80_02275 [Acetobacteraceae bacterium]
MIEPDSAGECVAHVCLMKLAETLQKQRMSGHSGRHATPRDRVFPEPFPTVDPVRREDED